MVSIITNTPAFEARRSLSENLDRLAKNQNQLSTGLAAPDPTDDPSGTAIGYDISTTLNALSQASSNTAQASAIIQLAVGTIKSDLDVLTRLNTLALQASSDSVSDNQRSMMDQEFQSLLAQIDSNSQISWAGDSLFNTPGNTKFYTFQIGPKSTDTITQNFNDLRTNGLFINSLNITDKNAAVNSLTNVQAAINALTNIIADFGGTKARLEAASRTLSVSIQNQTAARSVFIDVDVTLALIEMQKNSALVDTAAAMLQNTIKLFSRLSQLVVQGARN